MAACGDGDVVGELRGMEQTRTRGDVVDGCLAVPANPSSTASAFSYLRIAASEKTRLCNDMMLTAFWKVQVKDYKRLKGR